MDSFVSTYKNGKQTGRLLIDTFWYFLLVIVMFIAALFLLFANWKIDMPFFVYIPYFFVFLGIIALILGIRNLIPKTFTFDEYGIKFKIGEKERTAMWSEVSEIIATQVISYFGRRFVTFRAALIVKTKDWNCTLKSSLYDISGLQNISVKMAEYALKNNVKVIDDLGWLPKNEKFAVILSSGISVHIAQYSMLMKVGLFMLLIGVIVIVLGFFESTLFTFAIILLFFGAMLTLSGWFGIGEQKKKLKEERR